jgi:dienelactone hydrolase
MIVEDKIEIPTADGTAEGIIFRPEQGPLARRHSYTDIGGIRASQQEMARRLAEAGYKSPAS